MTQNSALLDRSRAESARQGEAVISSASSQPHHVHAPRISGLSPLCPGRSRFYLFYIRHNRAPIFRFVGKFFVETVANLSESP
ncbi:hypothetical protein SBA7_1300004 [Candidatus Sulfotelmatobacter sp. SbA7]|nr:hypothetical protein SBA7_1300004 [Candidatus Sulfotelmatobacter sp. SbA7]